jgi:hypothetical protein
MTGRLNELGEFGRGDDGLLAFVLAPQFVDGDGAAIAAHRKKRIIAYVEAGGQI